MLFRSPGCVWNATPRSLSPLERNTGFLTQAYMRSIGPAVTREESPAFLRNSNGQKGLSLASTAHPLEGWGADPVPKEQSLQGGSPCHPLDPGGGEVVENPCHLAPPPAQPCLDSVLFQKTPILGVRTWLPSGPQMLSVLLWGLRRQNKSP